VPLELLEFPAMRLLTPTVPGLPQELLKFPAMRLLTPTVPGLPLELLKFPAMRLLTPTVPGLPLSEQCVKPLCLWNKSAALPHLHLFGFSSPQTSFIAKSPEQI
jgi:hypothetical protein